MSDLQRQFEKGWELIDKHESFLLVSHEYTDGDDLGGIIALGKALEKQDKQVFYLAKGGVPDNLLFLPGHTEVLDKPSDEALSADVLVTLGCGDLGRAGFKKIENWDKAILNIDHHQDTEQFGDVNVWDKEAAANCELIYFFLKEKDIEIDKSMAQNLLTGIFTDTGGFRHANVTARTFSVSAELLRAGAKLDLVSRFTFSNKDVPQLRAWAVALENTRFDPDKKIIYTVITEEDLEKVGATEDDLEGVVELLNTIPEAKFSMLLKQRGEDIKGSLRSEPYKGVDVSKIAQALGGGGHKLAAGFKFEGQIEKTNEGWRIT